MAGEDHARVKQIFEEAYELAGRSRSAFLDRNCCDRPGLRSRVEALLAAAERDDHFLGEATVGAETLLSAAGGESAGSHIGPYRLISLIGEGGFGSVFLAEQERPVRRRVAMKVIKLGMDTRTVVARFEQERQALAIMDHPNIAKVLDAGATPAGRPYFVMEHVPGESITRFCDHRKLTIHDRLALFVQVCEAVQHAHTKGIIHRDIKPSNVLVSEEAGRAWARVIDFGIAKATTGFAGAVGDRSFHTEARQFIGTPEYMSPEQAAGGGGAGPDVDTRTDVYALGVLLYELLTGSTPFDSQQLRSAAYGELQRMILEVEPPRPSTRISRSLEAGPEAEELARRRSAPGRELGTLIRGELDWIVMKAIEKDPARRYQSPSMLSADVQRFLAGQAVEAAPPSVSYALRKFVGRNRVAVVAGAIVTTALLVGVVGIGAGYVHARVAREDERRQRVIAQENAQRAEAEASRADQEADTARRQTAVAESSLEFLKRMLGKADRGEQGGNPDVTVREVLDEASAQLVDPDARTTYQPEVRASLLATLGKTYSGLGLYQRARTHLEEALELRRQLHGVRHPEVATAMVQLSDVLHAMDMDEQGESLARQALQIRQELLPADHHALAVAQAAVGTHLWGLRRYAEAEPPLREALRILQLNPARDRGEISDLLSVLGMVVHELGRYTEAESLHIESLRLRREAYGDPSSHVAVGLNNLSWLYQQMQDYERAESLARQSLEMRIRLHGADHPLVALNLNNLAGLLAARGKLTEAEKHHREALEIRIRRLGDRDPRTLSSMGNLASVLQDLERWDEAEEMYRRSIELLKQVRGPQHPDVAMQLGNFATLLADRGRLAEAEQVLLESVEARKASQGLKHPDTAFSLRSLAVTRARQGRMLEAIDAVREVITIQRELFPRGHPELASSLTDLGLMLQSRDEYAAAEPPLREAVELHRRLSGPKHSSAVRAQLALAVSLTEQAFGAKGRVDPESIAKAAEGELLTRDGYDQRASSLPADDVVLGVTGSALGMAILAAEAAAWDQSIPGAPAHREARLLEAQSLLTEGYRVMTAKPSSLVTPERLRVAATRLVRLYEFWDDAQGTAEHQAQLAEWKAKVEKPRLPE